MEINSLRDIITGIDFSTLSGDAQNSINVDMNHILTVVFSNSIKNTESTAETIKPIFDAIKTATAAKPIK